MTMRVLDVGNCGPDYAAIRQLIERNFDAHVEQIDDAAGALQALRAAPVRLVLVNRKLDIDSSDGLEVVRQIKADPVVGAVPVMLISNYPEYQDEAMAVGAVRGFGKRDLRKPETVDLLRAWLAP